MSFAPAPVIDPPVRLPRAHGLFSVVSFPVVPPHHWENGVQWEAFCPDPLAVFSGVDCNTTDPLFSFPSNCDLQMASASAFTLVATRKTTPGPNNAQEKAREHLLAREETAVEKRLWGMLDQSPTVLTGGDPAKVLGALEEFIAQSYDAKGVIHAPHRAVVTLMPHLKDTGGILTTKLGTPVLVGAGYSGNGVKGAPAPAGAQFVAASPMVFGFRSEVVEEAKEFGDNLDRSRNDLYAVAERDYLLGYEPCGVAFAPLTLGCC